MSAAASTVREVRHSFEEPIGSRVDKLRGIRPADLATRFAFGFVVSVLAGTVTLLAGDRPGGLFLAFPAILPASLTLIANRDGRRQAEIDVAGAILGATALVSFAIVSWQLSGRTALGLRKPSPQSRGSRPRASSTAPHVS